MMGMPFEVIFFMTYLRLEGIMALLLPTSLDNLWSVKNRIYKIFLVDFGFKINSNVRNFSKLPNFALLALFHMRMN